MFHMPQLDQGSPFVDHGTLREARRLNREMPE